MINASMINRYRSIILALITRESIFFVNYTKNIDCCQYLYEKCARYYQCYTDDTWSPSQYSFKKILSLIFTRNCNRPTGMGCTRRVGIVDAHYAIHLVHHTQNVTCRPFASGARVSDWSTMQIHKDRTGHPTSGTVSVCLVIRDLITRSFTSSHFT